MRADRGHLNAVLHSAKEPSAEQYQRFSQFLTRTYRREVPLKWEEDPSIKEGFQMQVGSDVYDWTLHGRVRQFQDYLRQLRPGQEDIIPLMRQAVDDWDPAVAPG